MRVLMVAGFPLLRARRSAPSHIPWPFLDLTSVLSRCQILAWLVSWGGGGGGGGVARPGLMSMPVLDTVSPVVPPPSLGHLSVPPVVTVFTLTMLETEFVFFFLALQVSPCDPGCRCVDLFPPGWNDRFHLWRFRGCSSVGYVVRWVLPEACAWVPVYLVS